MKVFCSVLASSAYYLTTAKYLQENFHGSLKNRKSLIFHIYGTCTGVLEISMSGCYVLLFTS